MKAVDIDSSLLHMNQDPKNAGFVPALNYTFDANAKTVTITEASAYTAGDAMKNINVRVHDMDGNTAYGHIDGANLAAKLADKTAKDAIAVANPANQGDQDAATAADAAYVTATKVIIDVSGLKTNKPMNVTATVVSNAGSVSDGSANQIAAAGALENWTIGMSTSAQSL